MAMGLVELFLQQSDGVFFVWHMHNGLPCITFLRKRDSLSPEAQVDIAILEGSARDWELVGVGYWFTQSTVAVPALSVALLTLKTLPERQRLSTEHGIGEMKGRWIPFVCRQIRSLLWNGVPTIKKPTNWSVLCFGSRC